MKTNALYLIIVSGDLCSNFAVQHSMQEIYTSCACASRLYISENISALTGVKPRNLLIIGHANSSHVTHILHYNVTLSPPSDTLVSLANTTATKTWSLTIQLYMYSNARILKAHSQSHSMSGGSI